MITFYWKRYPASSDWNTEHFQSPYKFVDWLVEHQNECEQWAVEKWEAQDEG